MFCCIGVYSVNNSAFDVRARRACSAWSASCFTKLDCSPAPLVLGLVLAPMLEENFRRAMLISKGDPAVFVTSPVSAGILVLTVFLAWFFLRRPPASMLAETAPEPQPAPVSH